MEYLVKSLALQFIVLIAMQPLVRSQAVGTDCGGKQFLCLDDTRFQVCTDINGSGRTETVDGITQSCPPDKYCSNDGRFECDWPTRPSMVTAPPVITEPEVSVVQPIAAEAAPIQIEATSDQTKVVSEVQPDAVQPETTPAEIVAAPVVEPQSAATVTAVESQPEIQHPDVPVAPSESQSGDLVIGCETQPESIAPITIETQPEPTVNAAESQPQTQQPESSVAPSESQSEVIVVESATQPESQADITVRANAVESQPSQQSEQPVFVNIPIESQSEISTAVGETHTETTVVAVESHLSAGQQSVVEASQSQDPIVNVKPTSEDTTVSESTVIAVESQPEPIQEVQPAAPAGALATSSGLNGLNEAAEIQQTVTTSVVGSESQSNAEQTGSEQPQQQQTTVSAIHLESQVSSGPESVPETVVIPVVAGLDVPENSPPNEPQTDVELQTEPAVIDTSNPNKGESSHIQEVGQTNEHGNLGPEGAQHDNSVVASQATDAPNVATPEQNPGENSIIPVNPLPNETQPDGSTSIIEQQTENAVIGIENSSAGSVNAGAVQPETTEATAGSELSQSENPTAGGAQPEGIDSVATNAPNPSQSEPSTAPDISIVTSSNPGGPETGPSGAVSDGQSENTVSGVEAVPAVSANADGAQTENTVVNSENTDAPNLSQGEVPVPAIVPEISQPNQAHPESTVDIVDPSVAAQETSGVGNVNQGEITTQPENLPIGGAMPESTASLGTNAPNQNEGESSAVPNTIVGTSTNPAGSETETSGVIPDSTTGEQSLNAAPGEETQPSGSANGLGAQPESTIIDAEGSSIPNLSQSGTSIGPEIFQPNVPQPEGTVGTAGQSVAAQEASGTEIGNQGELAAASGGSQPNNAASGDAQPESTVSEGTNVSNGNQDEPSVVPDSSASTSSNQAGSIAEAIPDSTTGQQSENAASGVETQPGGSSNVNQGETSIVPEISQPNQPQPESTVDTAGQSVAAQETSGTQIGNQEDLTATPGGSQPDISTSGGVQPESTGSEATSAPNQNQSEPSAVPDSSISTSSNPAGSETETSGVVPDGQHSENTGSGVETRPAGSSNVNGAHPESTGVSSDGNGASNIIQGESSIPEVAKPNQPQPESTVDTAGQSVAVQEAIGAQNGNQGEIAPTAGGSQSDNPASGDSQSESAGPGSATNQNQNESSAIPENSVGTSSNTAGSETGLSGVVPDGQQSENAASGVETPGSAKANGTQPESTGVNSESNGVPNSNQGESSILPEVSQPNQPQPESTVDTAGQSVAAQETSGTQIGNQEDLTATSEGSQPAISTSGGVQPESTGSEGTSAPNPNQSKPSAVLDSSICTSSNPAGSETGPSGVVPDGQHSENAGSGVESPGSANANDAKPESSGTSSEGVSAPNLNQDITSIVPGISQPNQAQPESTIGNAGQSVTTQEASTTVNVNQGDTEGGSHPENPASGGSQPESAGSESTNTPNQNQNEPSSVPNSGLVPEIVQPNTPQIDITNGIDGQQVVTEGSSQMIPVNPQPDTVVGTGSNQPVITVIGGASNTEISETVTSGASQGSQPGLGVNPETDNAPSEEGTNPINPGVIGSNGSSAGTTNPEQGPNRPPGSPDGTGSVGSNEGSSGSSIPTHPARPNPAPFLCQQPGIFPHPNDRCKYYVCIWLPFGIYGLELNCTNGMVYNPMKQRCTEDKRPSLPNQFVCTGSGSFPDPSDNRMYYQCIRHFGLWIPIRRNCAKNQKFNATLNECATEATPASARDDSDSEEDSDEAKEKVKFECVTAGRFADPNDCSKYFICTLKKKDRFKKKQVRCPKGHRFDASLQDCSTERDVLCA
ncbi:mucin-19-like [Toxorhynchites rutilus septentrionalis]|uniref:mucin-19-like n=1 Tax=Toxorhynchites rutilus septentrionalis TaxID=329112 RepID=UPI0024785E68|nr:mucin-19-like [Toxorhynchites rutilus septentrionalis]